MKSQDFSPIPKGERHRRPLTPPFDKGGWGDFKIDFLGRTARIQPDPAVAVGGAVVKRQGSVAAVERLRIVNRISAETASPRNI
jgi:hypothetical protein